jgi:hypothetical protein
MEETILVSLTYIKISPMSAVHGDFEDKGFISECQPILLDDLVALMRGGVSSSYPPNGDTNELVEYSKSEDALTCEETIRYVEYYKKQTNPNAPDLWRRAFKLSGLL